MNELYINNNAPEEEEESCLMFLHMKQYNIHIHLYLMTFIHLYIYMCVNYKNHPREETCLFDVFNCFFARFRPGLRLLAHLIDLWHGPQQPDALLQGAQRELPAELGAIQERATVGLRFGRRLVGSKMPGNWITLKNKKKDKEKNLLKRNMLYSKT